MLSAESIQAALKTRRFGRPVHYYRKIHSTNDRARSLASRGATDGTLAIADEQTAGKGRLGRKWWAPSGSCLLMSLVLRPEVSPAEVQRLTMIAGLSCAQAIEEETGLRPDLKWPNDLLLDGRKLSGILTELQTSGSALDFAIVGIGLNVNVDFTQCDDQDLALRAIGLSQALGQEVDRLRLLNRLMLDLEERYHALLAGYSPHAEWSQRLITVGNTVRLDTRTDERAVGDEHTVIGRAVGVDANGALILQAPDGDIVRVLAGDVTIV